MVMEHIKCSTFANQIIANSSFRKKHLSPLRLRDFLERMIILRVPVNVEKQNLGGTWDCYNISWGHLEKFVLFNMINQDVRYQVLKSYMS